jgi:hypothetical protein
MASNFDPGYTNEPFQTLVDQAPDARVYPSDSFRIEWGPIFHRGRLNGTARVLCIGQDPAEHETIARRILVGTAGHRVQGFLAKLGITHSYAMVNTYLYSVYGQYGANKHIKDVNIAQYRQKWISALLAPGSIQAVVAFGGLADKAWQAYCAVPANAAAKNLAYQHVPHPTSPEGMRVNGKPPTKAQVAAAITQMLATWNTVLQALRSAIKHPDTHGAFVAYGTAFLPQELPPIPAFDLPAGSPAWMQGYSGWADRTGTTPAMKRRTITVKVPKGVIPT